MTTRLTLIETLALALVAVATLLALAFSTTPMTLGIGVGGVLAVANFYALRRLMLALSRAATPPRQLILSALLMLKFGVMGVLLFFVMTRLPVDGIGLLIGVSFVVIAIFVEGARMVLRANTAADDSSS
ncbi:MAG: ATP synthase subunit I [Deltaproteobacteria bacterium]|nr:ATP synthase subunit I [Deltaproteobacteria bacterium]